MVNTPGDAGLLLRLVPQQGGQRRTRRSSATSCKPTEGRTERRSLNGLCRHALRRPAPQRAGPAAAGEGDHRQRPCPAPQPAPLPAAVRGQGTNAALQRALPQVQEAESSFPRAHRRRPGSAARPWLVHTVGVPGAAGLPSWRKGSPLGARRPRRSCGCSTAPTAAGLSRGPATAVKVVQLAGARPTLQRSISSASITRLRRRTPWPGHAHGPTRSAWPTGTVRAKRRSRQSQAPGLCAGTRRCHCCEPLVSTVICSHGAPAGALRATATVMAQAISKRRSRCRVGRDHVQRGARRRRRPRACQRSGFVGFTLASFTRP